MPDNKRKVFIGQAIEQFINKYLKTNYHALPYCSFKNTRTKTAMIRILIADVLNSMTIDKLNEIPEFEIVEMTNLVPEKLAAEIKNVDAVVVGGTTRLTSAILKDAVNLKIIVLTEKGANQMDTAMANQKNIEIRNTPPFPGSRPGTVTAKSQEGEGLDVIAILKDFFNV